MEATLAMASLGRFNPDGPHSERPLKMESPLNIWTLETGKYSRNYVL
jgi:hypothetical protein